MFSYTITASLVQPNITFIVIINRTTKVVLDCTKEAVIFLPYFTFIALSSLLH